MSERYYREGKEAADCERCEAEELNKTIKRKSQDLFHSDKVQKGFGY